MNEKLNEKLELWRAKKKQLGLTNKEIAEAAQLPLRTVEQVMCGTVRSPRLDTVQAIERALGLNEKRPVLQDEVDLDDLYAVPLLGSVVAGIPIEAQENLEGYIYISYRPKEEYFALRVHGESMRNAGIFDGSVVVCHKQETAENGEIVVAMLNGEQTVKRFKLLRNNVVLMPENPDYDPIFVTERDELLILGKVMEVRVKF